MKKMFSVFLFLVVITLMQSAKVATEETICAKKQDKCRRSLLNSLELLREELSEDICQLQSALDAREREIQILEAALKTPIISFRARIGSDVRVALGSDVVFPIVDENLGNGYDQNSGVFTCPVSGLYSFGLHLMARSGYMEFDLLKGEVRFSSIIVHRQPDETWWYADSATVPTYCLKGETIKIVTRHTVQNDGVLLHNLWNYFSGCLLHVDRDQL